MTIIGISLRAPTWATCVLKSVEFREPARIPQDARQSSPSRQCDSEYPRVSKETFKIRNLASTVRRGVIECRLNTT